MLAAVGQPTKNDLKNTHVLLRLAFYCWGMRMIQCDRFLKTMKREFSCLVQEARVAKRTAATAGIDQIGVTTLIEKVQYRTAVSWRGNKRNGRR